jgi:hypothetical protein
MEKERHRGVYVRMGFVLLFTRSFRDWRFVGKAPGGPWVALGRVELGLLDQWCSFSEGRKVVMALAKRVRAERALAGANDRPDDKSFAARHEPLMAWLFDDLWEDGSKRKRGTISIRGENAAFTVSILDHGNEESAYVSGKTFLDALANACKAIQDPETRWVPWKRGKR